MPDPFVRENDTIAGKYLVGRTLGEGGMGVVVEARHLELDQMVAIKFLRPEIAKEGSSAERFRREARAAVKIRSEHVCRVMDVGTLESGVPYLVMEHLEGNDLSDEAERRGRLPVEEAVDYVLQACEALAEAHASGIVHRDLKPGNLFLASRPDGSRGIKVLDFGVSKSILESGDQLRLTKTASLVGSPLYMSPEQLDAAKDVDPRADIWALGTILFELVAGRTPFYAETIPQLVNAVMNGTPPTFAELGVSVPPAFETATKRALEKAREARYGTISDFARAIALYGPPHAMVSVLRTERVLSQSSDGKSKRAPSSPVASGQTPVELKGADTVATQTLDVSAPAGPTPATWGRTGTLAVNRKNTLTATLIGLLLLVGVVALAVGLLGKDTSKDADAKKAPPRLEPVAPTPDSPKLAEPAIVATATPPPSAVPAPPADEPPKPVAAQAARPPEPPRSSTPGATRPKSGARPSASAAVGKPQPTGDGISDFGGRR
ncbi:MAG TPA: protein kinase [Polyangiaceae bacterium]|nr:protein kinase [Polyangiaceae bacterium]